MNNTQDLKLEDEILPLFDFTFNFSSGKIVKDILLQPLESVDAIVQRQDILKGFLANKDAFKEYSYSRFNLAELQDFLDTFSVGSFSIGKLRWQLTFSEKKRQQKRGKLIQMVLLFHKLYSTHLSKLDLQAFPPAYQQELKAVNQYFEDFKLDHYNALIRRQKFRVRHIADLMRIITEKINKGETPAFWERWFRFEAYLSVSNGIGKNNFVFPKFQEAGFSIEGLFHPLLKKPVKNDLQANRNLILLTGPNMSGKSTFLKAVSLCVYLGHTGLAVPAASVSMPFFQCISVAINLTDSIVSGYSHFMTEVITLKNVVEQAKEGKRCFAVFDELFRGTNIEDAQEISTATIRGLIHFPQSLFFISTHLHQLKDIDVIRDNKVSTWYIDCELKDNIPAFNYKLKEGWSDLKLGRILFEKEGLNTLLPKTNL
ncbi:MAG: hypothetical protein QM726_11460 [Chitinophagaceae bacterium]